MDEVAQIREHTDIVALISEFVPLKKMGRNFKTPCPFHNEKTPSFVVSPERQIWHCFGCQKGGDTYTFLMEYEHIDFSEALRILSQKTGIALPRKQYDSGVSSQKETIYEVNRIAAEYYHYVLTKHPVGKHALSYLLETRQMNEKLLKTFLIGYSPKSGNALTSFLMKKKQYKGQDLVDAGLAFQRGSMYSDFFRDRIMFPLFDNRNNIVGFSGRILTDEGNMPKYINTRETLVYHKGDLFFGFDSAKEEMRKTGRAIIMEGEFDVISSFKAGIANVLAVKGTALTDNQVTLLSRYVQKVSLCFDQDKAGYEAIKRSLPILEKKGLTTTIIGIGNGKDADEAVKNDEIAFKQAVKNDIPAYDFLLERLTTSYNASEAGGKKQIADELLPLLSSIDNTIVKEHYVKKLSTALNTTYEGVMEQLEKLKKKEMVPEQVAVIQKRRSRKEVLEEYLLALLVQSDHMQETGKTVADILNSSYPFEVPACGKLLAFVLKFLTSHDTIAKPSFLAVLPQELVATFDVCFLLPLTKFTDQDSYEKEVKKVAQELTMLAAKKTIKELTDSIKAQERRGESEELTSLREALATAIYQLPK